jgi:dienelactone hydrolase
MMATASTISKKTTVCSCDMNNAFADLGMIRRGGREMTMGAGETKISPLSSAAEWEQKAAALRDLYRLTLGNPPDEKLETSPELVEEYHMDGYIKRKIAYNVSPDERIDGWLLLPEKISAGPLPAVLCIHQTTPHGKEQVIGNDPSPAGQSLAYALHLVKRGFITFAYDLLSAGKRCYPGLKDFDTAPFYEKYPEWSARGKDISDVSCALDVMQAMPEIDPERIACIGHSQGGGITIEAMALDSRIKVGVSSCGMWPMRFSKNPFNDARTGWWVGRPRLRAFCYTGKEFPVQMHELLAMSAPRAFMNISALNDFGYTADEAEFTNLIFKNMEENIQKIYGLYGQDVFENIVHWDGHGFFDVYREKAYSFIKEYL